MAEEKVKKKKKKNHFKYTEVEKNRIFQEEFYIHKAYLYNRAFYFTKDSDAANDLVQDTFLNTFRNIHQFESGTNAKAWLSRAMRNHFLNEVKKNPFTIELDYVPASKQLNPERGLDGLTDEYLEMLSTLKQEEKQPFLLASLGGYTYQEIAEILDLPIGTIRTQIHRAKNSLKEFIQNKTHKQDGNLL